jgi:3-deoxy-D-manno-octulosonate 8-phosphate phosphatase (KDO 8-P phosphatase)
MPTLAERMACIELLILDVDGVLTAGGVVYAAGESVGDWELKAFHVRDGSGVKFWREAGKRAAIITGRSSKVVARRAAELGIDPVIQGAADKLAAFEQILSLTGLKPHQAAAVGDDLPDVPVLRKAGLAVAVADACSEARRTAQFVTQSKGGQGAVRETIEWILRCQGAWQGVATRYAESAEDLKRVDP